MINLLNLSLREYIALSFYIIIHLYRIKNTAKRIKITVSVRNLREESNSRVLLTLY